MCVELTTVRFARGTHDLHTGNLRPEPTLRDTARQYMLHPEMLTFYIVLLGVLG